MYQYPKILPETPAPNPNNPTDEQRHDMLRTSLNKAGRNDDYTNIIGLLSPSQDITRYANPGEFKGRKVGIIGAGLAGMSAAFELRKLGYDITIFDPVADRIGGRVYTYYFDKEKRLYGEFGATRIPISHETTWHYINLFKLNTIPYINADPNTFTYVRNIRVRNDLEGQNIFHSIYPLFNLPSKEANTPWPELYYKVSRYYLSNLTPEIRKQFLMILPRYDVRFENIINMSIRQALNLYGLSSAAINLITSVMPITGSTIDNSFEGTLNDDYTMDYFNLYRIDGGMANLPLAFYSSLSSPNPPEYPGIPQSALGRITWKRGHAVYGLYKSGTDGKVVVKHRAFPSYTHYEDSFETFDYVICAITMSQLRLVDIQPQFSEGKMEAIKNVVNLDAQKTLFLCKERFWEKQGIFGGSSYTDGISQIISYPQDHTPNMQNSANSFSEPGVLTASYNVGQDAIRLGHAHVSSRYRFVREDVERVHGLPEKYLESIVLDHKTVDWFQEYYAKGAFRALLPGLKTELLYPSSVPEFNNRVFFAGEQVSTKNAWIQGALQTGMSAANDVACYSIIRKHQK
ncbi:flavin-dependent L-tryptophan oxidase RebO precursor [Oxobacter pfennigii]|uniref:Flavin-dependent L-tryptophan oxidase RebO n=1 Tax=Oxobacter pfennigii TaxID=36849 RepID=A0A0P8YSW8_9CLOT|nr:FAD-dependent oxidoreductase [Oxobacter pfennigii]KPU42771.1 flavin-dependent L-tryptophan oxidase RebO precursor [Oxobacter pfennigii]